MKNWDHQTGEVEMTDLNLPLDSGLLEQEELLGSESNSAKLSYGKSGAFDIMRAVKLLSGVACLWTIFQARIGLVSIICYTVLGLVSIQSSLVKNAGRISSPQESSVLAAILASYVVVKEVVGLYTMNGFHMFGLIAASAVLAVSLLSWRNKDLLSSKFTALNIGFGFVSLAAAVVMLTTSADTPILGDSLASNGQVLLLKSGLIAVLFIYGLWLNDKFGMVKKGPLAAMVILSIVLVCIASGVLLNVVPQAQRLQDDQQIFKVISVTHRDQVEEVCGDAKYAVEGKYLTKVWEGSNSEAYINEACMSSFAASLRAEASLLVNSLVFSVAFLVLAVVSSIERLLNKRVFKATSDQKNVLAGVLIISLVILVAFNVSLMHGDKFSPTYQLYKENQPVDGVVLNTLSSQSTSIFAEINSRSCSFEVICSDKSKFKIDSCTLNHTLPCNPEILSYQYFNQGFVSHTIPLKNMPRISASLNLGVLATPP